MADKDKEKIPPQPPEVKPGPTVSIAVNSRHFGKEEGPRPTAGNHKDDPND